MSRQNRSKSRAQNAKILGFSVTGNFYNLGTVILATVEYSGQVETMLMTSDVPAYSQLLKLGGKGVRELRPPRILEGVIKPEFDCAPGPNYTLRCVDGKLKH